MDRFGSLCTTRRAEGIINLTRSNIADRLLTDVASTCPLILTTGRGRGDLGQGTVKGSGASTRPDHVMMSADLFEKIDQIFRLLFRITAPSATTTQ